MKKSKISRKGFVEAAGVGAAGLAGAALAKGKPAKAQASPPPGQANRPDHAVTSEGAKLWLMSVKPGFQNSEVNALGGKVLWRWQQAGMALASSFSETFEQDVEGTGNINWAIPDMVLDERHHVHDASTSPSEKVQFEKQAVALAPQNEECSGEYFKSLNTASSPIADGPDVYAINGQWALYAIGAARPLELDTPKCSKPVPGTPGGPKSLYKLYYEPEWQLDKIDGHDYMGSGVTIGFVDRGVPAKWLDGLSPSAPLLDENGVPLNGIVRWDADGNPVYGQVKVHNAALHPDFDPYPGDLPDGSANPEGGIVMPGYDELDDEGNPIPDYLRLDRYDDDAKGALGHGTSTAGIVGARHWKQAPGAMRGLAPKAKIICYSQRDYLNAGILFSKILRAWKRAIDDGVDILHNGWSFYPSPTKLDNVLIDRLDELAWNAANELNRNGILVVGPMGNEGMNQHEFREYYIHEFPTEAPNVLTVSGTGPRDYLPFQPVKEQKLDMNLYMPDYAGRPFDEYNRMYNLDRPMHYIAWTPAYSEPQKWGGTNFGTIVDIAAPAGSSDVRHLCEKDQDGNFICPPRISVLLEILESTNNLIYTTSPLPNGILGSFFAPFRDYGLHAQWLGNSFSVPHVCGVAALAMEAYKRAHGDFPTPATLKHILKNSADDQVGPSTEDQVITTDPMFMLTFDPSLTVEEPFFPCEKPGHDLFYGSGRINAYKAILEAKK